MTQVNQEHLSSARTIWRRSRVIDHILEDEGNAHGKAACLSSSDQQFLVKFSATDQDGSLFQVGERRSPSQKCLAKLLPCFPVWLTNLQALLRLLCLGILQILNEHCSTRDKIIEPGQINVLKKLIYPAKLHELKPIYVSSLIEIIYINKE